MRYLFFPSDLGGGFGHISRCLSLAIESRRQGHECAFLLNDMKYYNRLNRDFIVFPVRHSFSIVKLFQLFKYRFNRFKRQPRAPLFMEFTSLSFQVLRDGLNVRKDIETRLLEYYRIISEFKPDVLIGDTNFLVWFSGKKMGIPVAQIVRYGSHPDTSKIIWWKERPETIIEPDIPAFLNPILEKNSLDLITKAEDLLRGDLYLIPSIPEIEPIPVNKYNYYVGELTIPAESDDFPLLNDELTGDKPVVYITIGGGAGPVGNELFFSTVIDTFRDKPLNLIISTGNKFKPLDAKNLPDNIKMFNWIPGKHMISKSDAVIFHGGYGTMMETISCGKPAIVIPFHSEQECNGRRIEKLGSGIVLKLSREDPFKIHKKWKYGVFSYSVQFIYDLSNDELYRGVNEILFNKKYAEAAKNLQKQVCSYGGAKRAVEIISSLSQRIAKKLPDY